MRILFIGGLYRGFQLAQRLLERGEQIVGAFVYEEDAHESPKYCGEIMSAFERHRVWCEKTRHIASYRSSEIRERLSPDLICCMGWRTMLPASILGIAPGRAIAAHDSLLPRLRGFAPTHWGLILGHDRLGATLFQLTENVDAGEVYFQESIVPRSNETYSSVQKRIAELSVGLFDKYLDAAKAGTLLPSSQNEDYATYTCARNPEDGEINWQLTSEYIDRFVRALTAPGPGAFTFYEGSPLFIVRADAIPNPRRFEGRIPGRLIERNVDTGAIDVLCGEGILRIHTVRTDGGVEQPAAAAVRSVRRSLGMNYSREVVALRERVEQLESKISSLQNAFEALQNTLKRTLA
jgi:methionyl-tRNA formyltransferase